MSDLAGDTRKCSRERGRGRKAQVSIAADCDSCRQQSKASEGANSLADALLVGVARRDLEDVNAVHRPGADAPDEVTLKARRPVLIGPADHRDLMATLEQRGCHRIRARSRSAVGRREVLVEVQDAHSWFNVAIAVGHRMEHCMGVTHGIYRRMGKRILDVVFAVALLAIGWIPMLAMSLVSRVVLGPDVLFRQRRPGLNSETFELVKFRTMRHVTEADVRSDGELVASDAERLTAWGRILRATSLDELPELWLVLRGDMSLVGPRPLLVDYLPLYSDHQARRHEVRPGLTGWAQVQGRNGVDWERRLDMDVWYVDNMSLGLDLRILGKTVATVLTAQGVSDGESATQLRFEGAVAPSDVPTKGR